MIRKLVNSIRTWFWKRAFLSVGKNVKPIFPLIVNGKSSIRIGDNTSIGSYVHIWGGGGVDIGSNVLIAAHTCISSLNHDYRCKLIRNGKMIKKKVIIEDDVWIGYNVVVLPGVTIGCGSVIGGGSVVTDDIPEYSIAVGNPAKVVKKRIIE